MNQQRIIYTSTEAAERGVPACYGYDGRGYTIGDRVELSPATDLWMRGARYGVVTGLSLTPRDRVRVKVDQTGSTIRGSEDLFRVVAS